MIRLPLIMIFVLALTVLGGCAANKELVIDIWPKDKIPNQLKTDIEEVQEYTDILKFSRVQKPTIEVFLPHASKATGKAMLIFPGGGYGILAYDWEGTSVAKFLVDHGIAGIVVKYRLPSDETQIDKHYVPLIDAQRAIRLVRSRSKEWNIDPANIGLIGFSAGGHLASTLGTQYDNMVYTAVDKVDSLSARPDFMVLMYPVITMGENTHKGSRNNLLGKNPSAEKVMQFSSDLQINEDTPATYLIHAMDDKAVPVANSEYFFALHNAKSNERGQLYIFEEGGHGFGMAEDNEILRKWPLLVLDWINSLETD
ncbi:acetyl esterase/lipase [Maribacter sp. MAR_2009_72]|nr:acetyl esterase/lipase [Maribacter sp. MAR_2009_72]